MAAACSGRTLSGAAPSAPPTAVRAELQPLWTLPGRRSECTQMHELTMAVAIMGEAHIQTHKLKATDDRSQWWLCIVAAACDLKLFGEVTSVMCGISMLT